MPLRKQYWLNKHPKSGAKTTQSPPGGWLQLNHGPTMLAGGTWAKLKTQVVLK